MFIRIKTTPNSPRQSIQIVEGYRDKSGNVKQRIVRHIGVAMNDEEVVRLKEVAEFVKANIEHERKPALFPPDDMARLAIASREQAEESQEALVIDNLKNLREEQRTIVGFHDVYGKVYKDLGFHRVFSNAARYWSASDYLYQIVMARIANPQSKRRSVQILAEDFGVELNLVQVYRMMDKLDEKAIEKIQALALSAAHTLLGGKIDVLFYDATTLYFESFTEDTLKQNGYSKDLKFNQPQVLLALFVTTEGLPVGYEVFPGSMYEGHTLTQALSNLEQRFTINRVVFVADSGLFNEENLTLLEEKGYSYIVGVRLRNTSTKLQKAILNKEAYQPLKMGDEEWRIRSIPLQKKRFMLAHYSPRRAHKDKEDRQKALDKLLKKLQQSKSVKSFVSNYGYAKFISVSEKTKVTLNEKKITQESQWDGLKGLITNIEDMSPESILDHYKGLWQIEETFRVTKHDLKVRPIFHWTPQRIKAHIAIAFMALTCVRYLEYRIALQQEKLSPECIRQALAHAQVSFVRHIHTHKRYGIPSKSFPEAKKIYHVMGLKLSDIPFEIKDI